MTRIAIVGGGYAATLHAEAALATPGVDLVGVGGRPGTAASLARATGVPDLPLAELVATSDGIVIAVPSSAAAEVFARIPNGTPILVESPVLLNPGEIETRAATSMAAVNLLHARSVKRGLRAIAELGAVHHLALRARAVRRDHERDVFSEPFAGVWPVLLGAAGVPVVAIAATTTGVSASVSLSLADGRTAIAHLEWVTPEAAVSAHTEIEAAGPAGVVNIALWPQPGLEVDGQAVAAVDDHPLVALGFVEQIRRFASMCDGRGEAWPPLRVGIGVTTMARAAALSAADGGSTITL